MLIGSIAKTHKNYWINKSFLYVTRTKLSYICKVVGLCELLEFSLIPLINYTQKTFYKVCFRGHILWRILWIIYIYMINKLILKTITWISLLWQSFFYGLFVILFFLLLVLLDYLSKSNSIGVFLLLRVCKIQNTF